MLVMCLKVWKNVISKEDGFKRHFNPLVFVEVPLDGRLLSDLSNLFFKGVLLSWKSNMQLYFVVFKELRVSDFI